MCAVILSAVVAGACSSEQMVPATAGDELRTGSPVSADLDADGALESILLDQQRRLHIEDGPATYHTREKWAVYQAFLADSDRNGLLEITALLDDADGRHLGLIGWMGDGYRERMVTQELTPRPLALEVVAGAENIVILEESVGEPQGGSGSEGEPPQDDGLETVRTVYRWNGFGFTAIGAARP